MIDWNALVEEHGPLVVGISWRILGNAADVEDNVQEVFFSAWRIHESQKVQHWRGLLRRLATVGALARLRRRRNHVSLDDLPLPGRWSLPEEGAIETELGERLRRAIAELPEREATVFSLRFFEDLDLREISQTLAVGYAAAAKALSRARSKLEHSFGAMNLEK